MNLLDGFVFMITVAVINGQDYNQASLCSSKTNCASCIQTSVCAWCTDPNFGESPRCFQPEFKSSKKCPEEHVINPDNDMLVVENIPLTQKTASRSTGENELLTQISPQKVKLKLRISKLSFFVRDKQINFHHPSRPETHHFCEVFTSSRQPRRSLLPHGSLELHER
jgi:hypothetical protein